MSDLDRFLKAQEDDYQKALKEIKNGKKVSCWMWYIFPQLIGLGMTQMSNHYGIKNMEEAIDYLKNEILRKRLVEISQALLDLDEEEDDNIHDIMGYPDDLKLRSCMTLFKQAEEISGIDCGQVFQKVLEKYFSGVEDIKTLNILKKQKKGKNVCEDNNSSDEEKNNQINNEDKKEENNNKIDNYSNKCSEEDKEKNNDNNSSGVDGRNSDEKKSEGKNNEEASNEEKKEKKKKKERKTNERDENKIQTVDSIDTISSAESIEDNGEDEDGNLNINENEKNNINKNNNIDKKLSIEEILNKTEKIINDEKDTNDKKINKDENEIMMQVRNDRIPNLKKDGENNDQNNLKCSFCPNINLCNII